MFTLEQIVPFGRSFAEYERMFALSDADLCGRILGCADGPASFNAEATARGHSVVSSDPLYRFDSNQIKGRIDIALPEVMQQVQKNISEFLWSDISSPVELERCRRLAMNSFLDDFEQGKHQGRYVDAELPILPFADASFELALCSHFLFLYTDHLSQAFHVRAILEMCRVAREVRIFPLLALDGTPSRYAEPVSNQLRQQGLRVSSEQVPYEFRRGANRMMRLREGC